MRLTLSAAKSTIARVLGVSASDSRVASYINEAVQRLMTRGDWRGTVARYRICVNDAKLTWPRQIETILKCNVCSQPVVVANKWYEFAFSGPGTLADDSSPGLVLQDMGEACAFDDIAGTDKTIKVISDQTEASGARILLQGYDEDSTWIRSYDTTNSEWVDGEYVTLSTTAQYTTNYFSNLAGVIKPATVGTIFLHEYEASTGSTKPLAQYEHDETLPSYRRSRIPSLDTVGTCAGETNCVTGTTTVNVLAKLRYIPVSADNDYIIIPNLPAIKDMVMSIDKAEKHLVGEAEYYEGRAIRELANELKNHEGGGIPGYDMQEPSTFGVGWMEGVV